MRGVGQIGRCLLVKLDILRVPGRKAQEEEEVGTSIWGAKLGKRGWPLERKPVNDETFHSGEMGSPGGLFREGVVG